MPVAKEGLETPDATSQTMRFTHWPLPEVNLMRSENYYSGIFLPPYNQRAAEADLEV